MTRLTGALRKIERHRYAGPEGTWYCPEAAAPNRAALLRLKSISYDVPEGFSIPGARNTIRRVLAADRDRLERTISLAAGNGGAYRIVDDLGIALDNDAAALSARDADRAARVYDYESYRHAHEREAH